MAAPPHPHATRQQSAAAAAAAAPPPSPPPTPLLFSLSELELCRTPLQRLRLFRAHALLLPARSPCHSCGEGTLHDHADDSYADGYRVQCSRCGGNFSPRRGSFFAQFTSDLLTLGRLLCYFDARLLVHQAEQLSRSTRSLISRFSAAVRVRCASYITAHPILFPADEIVEIDELYVRALREPATNEEKASWPPIIGLIGRSTGMVALEIAPTHATRDIRPLIERHLPHANTRVITDEHKSFQFLSERYEYNVCFKEHRGAAAWPLTYNVPSGHGGSFPVHTNTIEGYWSQLRTWLHASHGWPADYLPLFLSECMFRSLRIPLSVALRPLFPRAAV